MILPDPDQSRAVLVGVSNYVAMPKLPNVANNVEALRYSLTGAASWNLPFRHCVAVHDPRNTDELVDPILESANAATDTLLVYYAGHGTKGPNRGELRLTSTNSRPNAPYTATLYDDIRDILLASPAARRIVILDCCYAARALGAMADSTESIAEDALIEGTYLIAATGETQIAKADGENGFTAFTAELIHLLRNGVQDSSQALLDLDTTFNQLVRSLRAKSLPVPQRRVRNSPGNLAIAWNRQWMTQQLSNILASRTSVTEPITAPTNVSPPFNLSPTPVDAPRTGETHAGERRPVSLPRIIEKEAASNSTSAHLLWPKVLEAVKSRRRFTWILLSQHAKIVDLDSGKVQLVFINKGSLDNYVNSGSEPVLQLALSDVLGQEYEIEATVTRATPTPLPQDPTQPLTSGNVHAKFLTTGDEIEHEKFGRGIVLSTTGKGESAVAIVNFGDGKPKRLLLRYTPFTKVEENS
ncbi:caspase family protein [Streptomyces sp. NPDC019443]|uniref:caspase family protein n=1 Tax=Streptomyces sp. NPDC019443 TaxID=3365061 RepID=UPI0037A0EE8C